MGLLFLKHTTQPPWAVFATHRKRQTRRHDRHNKYGTFVPGKKVLRTEKMKLGDFFPNWPTNANAGLKKATIFGKCEDDKPGGLDL